MQISGSKLRNLTFSERKNASHNFSNFIQYKNRSNKEVFLITTIQEWSFWVLKAKRVFNIGKKLLLTSKFWEKKWEGKLNCYVTFSANHVFYWNMLRMNFWNYSTFHNLVALQEPMHWVDNSSREKEGTHQTAFGQPQIIWRQHLWDRPVFFRWSQRVFFWEKFLCVCWNLSSSARLRFFCPPVDGQMGGPSVSGSQGPWWTGRRSQRWTSCNVGVDKLSMFFYLLIRLTQWRCCRVRPCKRTHQCCTPPGLLSSNPWQWWSWSWSWWWCWSSWWSWCWWLLLWWSRPIPLVFDPATAPDHPLVSSHWQQENNQFSVEEN